MLSRRTMLGATVAGALPLPALAKPGRQLRRDLETFAAFGEHRSGSDPARHAVRWLAGRLAALGYLTQLDPFPVTTFTDPWVGISVARETIAGFVQWLPRHGQLTGMLTGPIFDWTKGSPIPNCLALISKPAPLSAYWPESLESAVAAARQARAVILAVDDPLGGIFAYNRNASLPRLPVPVLLVDRAGMMVLKAAAERGQSAVVRGKGRVQPADAFNCRATMPGTGRSIVLSTPLTGWFRCGAERGAGVAALLELARSLKRTGRRIELVATGAHEIGHLGMQRAIANGIVDPKDIAIWCHLGASLGATALDETGGPKSVHFMMANTPEQIALRSFVDQLGLQRLPATRTSPGEAGDVLRGGFDNVIAFTGVFPGFHTPADDGRAVDTMRLESYCSFLETYLPTYQ